jgi:hypothetical protein
VSANRAREAAQAGKRQQCESCKAALQYRRVDPGEMKQMMGEHVPAPDENA